MDHANEAGAAAGGEDAPMAVAVVGLALRFPGAEDARQYWRNLVGGVDSITRLDAAGRERLGLPQGDEWITAAGVLEEAEGFDAAFFGYSAREAEQMDPQHRALLECAWAAMESAGYAPRGQPMRAAVYAGAGFTTYGGRDVAAGLAGALGLSGDFLATRVSYELDLTGPAMTVQTACSTSLVALHLACQSLLAGECDLALAGGVSIRTPQLGAHRNQEGGILAPDGRCRPFDVNAAGTAVGNGVGMLVLKRLADAVADRDSIRAIVLGTALNNDGGAKTGFAAPSVQGQAAVIREALSVAGVAPSDVSYVEAHGTATALGDPIEVAALKQVFQGVSPGACGLGGVKSNFGHLDAAAGVAGVIKTVLSMEHRTLPPTLNFTKPHPMLELEGSPFQVVGSTREWVGPLPLRAGVTALGIGGTNAHVVLQEAPALPETDAPRRGEEVLLLSAKTEGALDRMTAALAERVQGASGPWLADVAHTLQVGRARFPWRRFVVVRQGEDAAAVLEGRSSSGEDSPPRMRTVFDEGESRGVAFLFPGGGAQRVNMGEAFLREPAFRAAIDGCAEWLRGPMGADLRDILFAGPERFDAAARELDRPLWSQPALFVCDWALAQLWLSWGVKPEALLGHSLGEYVAACLAGVFTLEEALGLVVARGRLMEAMPPGGMLSVLAPVELVSELVGPAVSVAAINGPETCVLSGPLPELEAAEQALTARGIEHKRVRYARAAHSSMMEPSLEGFAREVARVKLRAPSLPVVSSLTGRWLQDREATSPDYWVRHLRHTVRFSDALGCLLESGDRALIEVGPGTTLTALARQHPARKTQPVLATLSTKGDAPGSALSALGEAWAAGVDVDWEHLRDGERRRRVDLPTYSFDREHYSLDDAAPSPVTRDAMAAKAKATGPSKPKERAPRRGERVAPRDATEQSLAECFQTLFRLDDVSIHDDFFALGGDSLVALRLLAMISERFGKRLALKEMLTAPTVELLARKLGGREDAQFLPPGMALLQQGTRGPPLFFVHAAGGQSVFYRDLARAIDASRTAYAFESRGLEPDGPLHTSVDEMATAYLEGLRALQPVGPYLLVGASFGGAVVYEMARRLAAEGHAVPLCAMLDTPGPGDIARARAGEVGLAQEQVLADPEQQRRYVRVWEANMTALRDYPMPRFEGGTLQFFRAATVIEHMPKHVELEWLDSGAVVRVETVPGDHQSMLTGGNAEGLGAKLAAFLP
ncbi:malonyl CoA-acyl carrier protein transacylase [Corallococcus coralloides DSM 2259]|uniref:Malonyl CoA-acyl carrier protein transacylase n=1 Tax=Corallococcus coralloides (strain ATCC 25202 / DSM 2259 / NBRC 100086 / M2) TaxID=1144275 RepID=H8MHQ8_CORCM|nr:type I polyketide synthase [Corallococcus coralloides]AFE09964.1 malonyl CoA-acyl carrier protein transacylase [Corallococcus coralloides DSM 2259]